MSKFNRTYSHFAADIEDIIAVSEKRMTAVARQSLQDVSLEANLATAKGGRMRVDTGFLRASGQASLNGMPIGPTRPVKGETYDFDETNNIAVTLGTLKFGATYFFGWTAEYARYREIYDGFMEGALQHWAQIVAFHTDTVRETVNSNFYAKRNEAWGQTK